jgi:hypothetical protein
MAAACRLAAYPPVPRVHSSLDRNYSAILLIMARLPTVQNAILAALKVKPDLAYAELAEAMFGPNPTASQQASMRRAIGVLIGKGLIETRAWYVNPYGITHSGMSVQLVGAA